MKWRRRQYLIDQKFQWCFVRRLIIPLILGLVIITLVDYYFIWSFLTPPVPGRYENMELPSLKIITYILFYALCVFIPIMVIIGIIVSHRIAGPLFQIERVLKSIGEGDLTSRVSLRHKDELKDLAMSINKMVAELSDKISDVEKNINFLEEKLLLLKSEAGKDVPDINKLIEEIKAFSFTFNTLRDKVDKFKR